METNVTFSKPVLLVMQVEEVIPLSETVDNYIHFLPNLRHQFSPHPPLNVPSASIILLSFSPHSPSLPSSLILSSLCPLSPLILLLPPHSPLTLPHSSLILPSL
jgi:hypothetical protein